MKVKPETRRINVVETGAVFLSHMNFKDFFQFIKSFTTKLAPPTQNLHVRNMAKKIVHLELKSV